MTRLNFGFRKEFTPYELFYSSDECNAIEFKFCGWFFNNYIYELVERLGIVRPFLTLSETISKSFLSFRE